MTELQRLLTAYAQQLKNGTPCALATVVQVEGSAYRRPGARMLITGEGLLTGTISGGCLEGDARRRAQQVMMRGKPEIVIYDSMDLEEDLEHGAQLGCQGKVHVLIEPLFYDQPNVIMQLLTETIRQEKPALLTTVLSGRIQGNSITGLRLLLLQDGEVKGEQTANDELNNLILTDARLLLKESCSASTLYEIEGEEIIVFNELIHPAPSLTVYGAGNDVQPLVKMAYNLGWRVSVVDGRSNLVTKARFPEAESVSCVHVDDLSPALINNKGYAVLMSHNYFYDLGVLQQMLTLPQVKYIGLLGPRKKADRLLNDLEINGFDTHALKNRLYGPVGLDIGAEAAEEIAVAIMAELIAVRNAHPAGFLKDLEGPIHKNEFKIQQNA